MNFLNNNTVVIPVDFSDQSVEAVKKAIELAEESTQLHVIHVVDPTPIMISMDPALPIPASYDQGRHDDALKELTKRFGKSDAASITVHCSVGDPGTEIANYAQSIEADLIIMPSHGRTGLNRLLLGSVAERVLRMAQCPVLVLRGAR